MFIKTLVGNVQSIKIIFFLEKAENWITSISGDLKIDEPFPYWPYYKAIVYFQVPGTGPFKTLILHIRLQTSSKLANFIVKNIRKVCDVCSLTFHLNNWEIVHSGLWNDVRLSYIHILVNVFSGFLIRN